MDAYPTVLLLHMDDKRWADFRSILGKQPVATVSARTCAEALKILQSETAPAIIFADVNAFEDKWAEVLSLPRRSPVPVNLVVVSAVCDVSLCVAAMEAGAFDFIVPPIADADLGYVLKRAVDHARTRRNRVAAMAKTA